MRPSVCLKLILLLLISAASRLAADQFGLFTYSVVDDTAVTITGYPESASGLVTIPSEIAGKPVTALGPVSFAYCVSLTSIIIPSGVTSIGDAAFSGCTGLSGVSLPSTVTSIGGAAFESCTGLTTLALPPGISSIATDTFYNCQNLASISLPANVTSIGSSAFAYCRNLTDISLPSGLTSIREATFYYCENLTSITLPAGVSSIQPLSFEGCYKLASINLPDGVTAIGENAFQYCFALTSISFPASIRTIGRSAFYACSGLSEISIPAGVGSIGDFAFLGCSGLTGIEVAPLNAAYSSNEGVLFNNTKTSLITCPAKKSGDYIIPSGVITLEQSAFATCNLLSSISIPASVESIGRLAFSGCTGLTHVEVAPLNQAFSSSDGILFSKTLSDLLLYPAKKSGNYRVPDSVASIGQAAFFDCSGLTAITIPSGVAFIGDNAFGACTNLTSIALPSSVTSIGNYAFYACSGLTSIIIPASIGLLEQSVFEQCTGLVRLVFLGNAPRYFYASLGDTAPGFTIYSLSSKTGFTIPMWRGYSSLKIDVAAHPAASWLLTHDLWYETNLSLDPDGDGVSLLMAYALNLDPRINLSASLPAPVLHPDRLSLTFHAASAGITYEVETSTGLDQWTTEGVTLSAIGADQRRTASVPRSGPGRFLRLKVAD